MRPGGLPWVRNAAGAGGQRAAVAVLLLGALAGGCAAPGASVAVPEGAAVNQAQPPAVSLDACLWSWRSKGADEWRYGVDVASEKLWSESTRQVAPDDKPACYRRWAERKQRDALAYQRMAQAVERLRGSTELDAQLLKVLAWIARSTQWGATRGQAVNASPDGAYAVIALRGEPLLLVQIETLETRVLAPPHRDLPTPVAWAADSRQLAFAPPGTDHVQIYDVAQGRVVASHADAGRWVAALAWSPDGQRIAAFSWRNRRMNKSPLGLLGAAAGHPEFRNDGVHSVYRVADGQHFSLVLQRGMAEMSSPNAELVWRGTGD